MKKKNIFCFILIALISIVAMFVSDNLYQSKNGQHAVSEVIALNIPDYNGKPYTEVNDNQPFFDNDDITTEVFETYSDLDYLGRCGTAYANICKELMPTEERGEIGMIKPTGWHTVKYNDIVAKPSSLFFLVG